jgi:hypothetical protein
VALLSSIACLRRFSWVIGQRFGPVGRVPRVAMCPSDAPLNLESRPGAFSDLPKNDRQAADDKGQPHPLLIQLAGQWAIGALIGIRSNQAQHDADDDFKPGEIGLPEMPEVGQQHGIRGCASEEIAVDSKGRKSRHRACFRLLSCCTHPCYCDTGTLPVWVWRRRS